MLRTCRSKSSWVSQRVHRWAPALCALGVMVGVAGRAEAVITATKSGATLTILGDPSVAVVDNITVTGNNGTYTVAGFANPFAGITTIKIDGRGGAENVVVQNLGLAGSLEVKTRSGPADVGISAATIGGNVAVLCDEIANITISNVSVTGNFSIETKNGSDEVELHGAVDGSVTIKTGDGVDTVEVMEALVGLDVSIDTGDDTDTVLVQNANVGRRLTVKAGAGTDTVTILDAEVEDGDATIDTGAGEGTVRVDDFSSFDRNLTIKTGNDLDTVNVWCGIFVRGQLLIETYAGTDVVEIRSAINVALGNLIVRTGNDNDDVRLTQDDACGDLPFSIGGDLVIETGAGSDTVSTESQNSTGMYPFIEVLGDTIVKTGDQNDGVDLSSLSLVGGLTIDTGNHMDNVGLTDMTILNADPTTIALGGGNDSLHLDHTSIASIRTLLDGGNGTADLLLIDTLTTTFDLPPVIKGFE